MSQNPEVKLKNTSTYKFASVLHNLRDSFPDRYVLPYFANASHKIEHCLYGTYRVAILHHRFLGGSSRANRAQVDSRRTGRRLISSRSATMRRDNRIKESRISSSSLRVRLRSSGVYTRLRLKSSLSSSDKISSLESANKACLLSVKYSWLNKPSVRLVFLRNNIYEQCLP